MILETDLPWSDCGAPLREHPVDGQDLRLDVQPNEQTVVAECVDCRARFYPEQALGNVQPSTPSVSNGGA